MKERQGTLRNIANVTMIGEDVPTLSNRSI